MTLNWLASRPDSASSPHAPDRPIDQEATVRIILFGATGMVGEGVLL